MMRTFASAREAKEFLVSKIVAESQRAEMAAVNDAFDHEYSQAEYEQKIGKLIRNLSANDRAHHREDFEAWNEALSTLRQEDHYLRVLAAAAELSSLSARRFLKLTAIALVVAGVIVEAAYLVIKSDSDSLCRARSPHRQLRQWPTSTLENAASKSQPATQDVSQRDRSRGLRATIHTRSRYTESLSACQWSCGP